MTDLQIAIFLQSGKLIQLPATDYECFHCLVEYTSAVNRVG